MYQEKMNTQNADGNLCSEVGTNVAVLSSPWFGDLCWAERLFFLRRVLPWVSYSFVNLKAVVMEQLEKQEEGHLFLQDCEILLCTELMKKTAPAVWKQPSNSLGLL